MPSVDGQWTRALSGGLPPAETWAANPQFAIVPTVDGATYTVEVVRHDTASQVRCGLWVMKAEAVAPARKKEFTGMVEKSKVSTNERRSLELKLPLRRNALPYVAIVATQEPGIVGSFTLTVTSVEDEGVSVVPLQEEAAASVSAGAGAVRATGAGAVLDSSAVPAELKSFNPSQGGGGGAGGAPPAPGKDGQASFAFRADDPDNVPTLDVIGQGLSKKLLQDAANAVAAAEAAASASGGLYEDPDFPASDVSLGAEASSLGVVSWRRLGEIEPPEAKPRGGDGSLLCHAEGCGLRVGSLRNEWLLGAINVVGGNVDVVERTFVDMAHGESGFYAVRLYAEDPNSDDDWQVVLVDDRIPCAADGLPAFGRGARAGGLWAALVEKAAAKRFGSYAALQGDGGGEATLRGLELLTGGKARELVMATPADGADALAEAWSGIKEALGTDQVVCARCDAGSPMEASASEMGIVPGRTYCVVVANDMMGGGQQLMRLRGFVGDAEWNGEWSDHSDKWTSRLRQLLAYSKDDTDGTFWMAYADFAKYFTSAYAARVADDRWSRFTVKSRWMDQTAGGPPGLASWRDNYQWLLTVPRETTMTLSLSLPDPRLSAPDLLARFPPIGLMIVQGNGGAHGRRRKLRLDGMGDVVYEAGPRPVRRLQVTTTLPPSPEGSPYLLVPYTSAAGAEAPFTLRILLDDVDDDGKADIVFEPCLPNPPNREDWCCKRLQAPWARAAGAPSTPQFVKNDRLSFTLQSTSASEGTVRICVETIGIATDMRGEEGMQSGPQYPPIGIALCPSAEGGLAAGGALPANAQVAGPMPTDAVWLEATLPVGGAPHVVVPYLGAGSAPPPGLQFALSVYSDLPLGVPEPPQEVSPPAGAAAPVKPPSDDDGPWACELCDGADSHGPVCPYRLVIEKMSRMEALMDERMRFLDERLAA